MQGSNWALNVLHEFLAGETDGGLKGMKQPAAPITVHFVCVTLSRGAFALSKGSSVKNNF